MDTRSRDSAGGAVRHETHSKAQHKGLTKLPSLECLVYNNRGIYINRAYCNMSAVFGFLMSACTASSGIRGLWPPTVSMLRNSSIILCEPAGSWPPAWDKKSTFSTHASVTWNLNLRENVRFRKHLVCILIALRRGLRISPEPLAQLAIRCDLVPRCRLTCAG